MSLAKARKAESRMNGYEQDYENLFLGQLVHGFAEITLRLGDDCRYTPDFWVIAADDVLEFHEVKGMWRDDARAKISIAAEKYPQFRFKAFRKLPKKQGGLWQVEHFGQPDEAA